MTKLCKILFFIGSLIKFVFLFDRKETLLLLAQEGNGMEQLKLADYLYIRGDYINAYAWAETARYQGIVEAEKLKLQLWDLIPADQKMDAQNLARKFRMTYTKNY